jgi:hypothetical protein
MACTDDDKQTRAWEVKEDAEKRAHADEGGEREAHLVGSPLAPYRRALNKTTDDLRSLTVPSHKQYQHCSGILRKRPPSCDGMPTEPVLVRYLAAVATSLNPLTTHSQETTVHRCRQNVTGHQVVFRRHQRPADQTLRGASVSNNPSILSTNVTYQYTDVKGKSKNLIPRLKKLADTLAKVNPNDDREEVQRRSQLTMFVSCLQFIVRPKLIPYGRSWNDVGTRFPALSEKGRSLGSSIRRKICKESLDS